MQKTADVLKKSVPMHKSHLGQLTSSYTEPSLQALRRVSLQVNGPNSTLMEITSMNESDNQRSIDILNEIMEAELAGVVRYSHYALMVFGYNRIPIVSWMKSNATEGLAHAQRAGELVTMMGGHPSLKIGSLLETEKHDIGDILRESLEHEHLVLQMYYTLLEEAVASNSILLEEYAREMITAETLHLDEVNKMLRSPGEIEVFKP